MIWGVSFLVLNTKKLPSINTQGHIEKSPDSHILIEEIPENIQKHILEHADGNGKLGVIVQYFCKKFVCEDNLIENLTKIVEEFLAFVYLTPNSKYYGKIILTRAGKIKVLDDFNEKTIRDFLIN